MKSFVCIVVVASLAFVSANPLNFKGEEEEVKIYANFTFGPSDNAPNRFTTIMKFGEKAGETANFNDQTYKNGSFLCGNLKNINKENGNNGSVVTWTVGDGSKKMYILDILVVNGNETFKFCNDNATEAFKLNTPYHFKSCNGASSLFLGLGSAMVVLMSMFTY